LNKYCFILLLFIFTFPAEIKAQQLSGGFSLNEGLFIGKQFDPGLNGFSLSLQYNHPINTDLAYKAGLEYGLVGWGSQFLLSTGIMLGGEHQFTLEILNGFAPYRQKLNYLFGGGIGYLKVFFINDKNLVHVSVGLRYLLQPDYKNYSSNYFYFDIPLKIAWGRKLM
jgi:hypothetical protein